MDGLLSERYWSIHNSATAITYFDDSCYGMCHDPKFVFAKFIIDDRRYFVTTDGIGIIKVITSRGKSVEYVLKLDGGTRASDIFYANIMIEDKIKTLIAYCKRLKH